MDLSRYSYLFSQFIWIILHQLPAPPAWILNAGPGECKCHHLMCLKLSKTIHFIWHMATSSDHPDIGTSRIFQLALLKSQRTLRLLGVVIRNCALVWQLWEFNIIDCVKLEFFSETASQGLANLMYWTELVSFWGLMPSSVAHVRCWPSRAPATVIYGKAGGVPGLDRPKTMFTSYV